jgi:hypothetical protein
MLGSALSRHALKQYISGHSYRIDNVYGIIPSDEVVNVRAQCCLMLFLQACRIRATYMLAEVIGCDTLIGQSARRNDEL